MADCYAADLSARNFNLRKELFERIFRNIKADIILLQEIDHWEDFYQPLLQDLGFNSVYFQRPTRKDGLVIASLTASGIVCAEVAYVSFDDLAEIYQDSIFAKQNVGVMCRFKYADDIDNSYDFVVCTSHLHWNPARGEVKIAQARYLLERIASFAKGLPVLLGGDFNTVPNNPLYKMLTSAPGFATSIGEHCTPLQGPGTKFLLDAGLKKLCKWMRLLGIDTEMEHSRSYTARTRKDKPDFSMLFEQARAERRVLLTSSRAIRERAACPPSHHVDTGNFEASLKTIVSKFQLEIREDGLMTMCALCGGRIDTLETVQALDESFIIRTDVSMNGEEELGTGEQSSCSSTSYVPTDRPVFACVKCHQLYWFNDKYSSSPARAMRVAKKLFELISDKNAGNGTLESEETLTTGSANMSPAMYAQGVEDVSDVQAVTAHEQELVKLFHTRNEAVISKHKEDSFQEPPKPTLPSTQLKTFVSAYAAVHKVEPPCTNWTTTFKDTLDYILVSDGTTTQVKVMAAEIVPYMPGMTANSEHNAEDGSWEIETQPQPSEQWPSDHFIVRAKLVLAKTA